MPQNEGSETAGMSWKTEHLVHWFFAAVSLIYGCGFLIVFTFFKSYGIDSADFIEARYIHVGFLFFLACLVVITPIWWLLWPLRSKIPDRIALKIKKGIFKGTLPTRIRYALHPVKSFLLPEWSIDPTHGIHANPAVRLSMIIILWSFIALVMFAAPDFGRNHPKLVFVNFLTPMAVLILGLFADFFKDGNFSGPQSCELKQTRFILRLWWPIMGAIYLCSFPFHELFFERHCKYLAAFYFTMPLVVIVTTFLNFIFRPSRATKLENMQTRLAACQWFLCVLTTRS